MSSETIPEDMPEITPGLQSARLYDGRIVVFKPVNATRTTVDGWFDVVLQTVNDWEEGRLYLELQDMSAVSITPYNRKRAGDLTKRIAHQHGFTAVMIEDTFLGRVMGNFVNFLARSRQNMERRIFTDQDKGLDWLVKKLED